MSKARRVRRLLGTKRPIIVALDHGRMIHAPGLADPAAVLRTVAMAGADGLMLTAPMAERFETECGELPIVVSVSVDHPSPRNAVLNAVRVGAEAIEYEVFPDTEAERANYSALEGLAVECSDLRMPLMAEVVPGGFTAIGTQTSSSIARGARMAAECGADLLKVPTPHLGSIAEVIENATLPVLLLGGPRNSDPGSLAGAVSDGARLGIAGLVVGRHIWESDDPREAISELRAALRAPDSSLPES